MKFNFSHFNIMRFPLFAKLLEDNKINITFSYTNIIYNRNHKQYNFIRSYEEPLSITLQKIKSSIILYLIKSKPNIADGQYPLDLNVVYKDSNRLDIDTNSITVGEAFRVKGSEIIIEDCYYDIIYNPPYLKTFKLPKEVMVGCPVFPIIEGNRPDCSYNFKWLKSKHNILKHISTNLKPDDIDLNKWDEISNTQFYTPTIEDKGTHLAVQCVPELKSLKGPPEVILSSLIKPEPKYSIIKDRHEKTDSFLKFPSLRICSYNLLADLYAKSDYSKKVLFPYCPKSYLSYDYRKNILYKEIIGYNADIICLQEVDQKFYYQQLHPGSSLLNYSGSYRYKSNTVVEGCCTLFQTSKFEFISSHDIEIPLAICQSSFFEKIAANTTLKENVTSKKAVCQITILKCKDSKGTYLCVCNTHLYFLPTAPHVRLIQLASILERIQQVVNAEFIDKNISTPVIILCGDFNSSPETDVYKFMINGKVNENASSWPKEKEPEAFGGLSLEHSFNFYSVCGEPEYTNFVPGFQKCIDYIFAQRDRVKSVKCVPFPSRQQIESYTALPNEELGSDHLALVCDIELINI